MGKYPGIIGALKATGVVNPDQADDTQIMLGLTNHIATQLKPTWAGSSSDLDVENYKSTLPQLMQTPQGRAKALAYLQNMSDRVAAENEFQQKYFRRIDPATGQKAFNLDGVEDAMAAPRTYDQNGRNIGGLGPLVPQMPAITPDSSPDSVRKWMRENVDIGHPHGVELSEGCQRQADHGGPTNRARGRAGAIVDGAGEIRPCRAWQRSWQCRMNSPRPAASRCRYPTMPSARRRPRTGLRR